MRAETSRQHGDWNKIHHGTLKVKKAGLQHSHQQTGTIDIFCKHCTGKCPDFRVCVSIFHVSVIHGLPQCCPWEQRKAMSALHSSSKFSVDGELTFSVCFLQEVDSTISCRISPSCQACVGCIEWGGADHNSATRAQN